MESGARKNPGRNDIEDFSTTQRRRRRRFWILLAAILICVPVLIYIVVASVTSTAAENPPSTPKNASANAQVSGEDPQDSGSSRVEPSDKDSKQSGSKKDLRTAPLPPPGKSCDDLRVLVDHTHSLPSSYVPQGLVSLDSYGIATLDAGPVMRRPAARHLKLLMAAAATDGEELIVASAYRSYAEQQQTFTQFTDVYGDETDTVSAPPGQSQHQLGTAVDFTNSTAGYRLWWPFGDTTASTWLLQNASDYGFVLAYPDGKQKETGYQWEPWHYRYIGMKNVAYLEKEKLTLQQFLVQEKVLPRC